MAYDGIRQRLVLFGGEGVPYTNDTWEWDGSSWTQRFPAVSPGQRANHAMAFDPNRGRIILYGGSWCCSGYAPLDDTWEWDGSTWIPRPGATLGLRCEHSLAFDTTRNAPILFGGFGIVPPTLSVTFGDTWQFDGSAWSLLSQAGPHPRRWHSMAFDSARGRAVLFGGFADQPFPGAFLGDTWEWNGASWLLRSSSGPSARRETAMAYDSVRSRVVLFGGYVDPAPNTVFDDTWEWSAADAPTFVRHPTAQFVRSGRTATFDASSVGSPHLTYRWRKDTIPLSDGGRISGATTQSLQIASVQLSDAGSYDLLVSNACGSPSSNPATLTIICYPNCDFGTVPPILNVSDFVCFMNRFSTGDPYANCDASTLSPFLSVSDFICFFNEFAIGCQ